MDSRISVRPAQRLKLTALLKISALAQLVHPGTARPFCAFT